jgi:zinc-ribbon domain
MAEGNCPQCGSDVSAGATTCSECGQPLNGAALPGAGGLQQTPPPAQPSGKLSPELREWARQQFSEEEFLAGLREVQETGGVELKDFIKDLEQEAGPRE